MPELPEVETVRVALANATSGGVVRSVETSGKVMRWPIPGHLPDVMAGASIRGYRRRGKYILMDIEAKAGMKDGPEHQPLVVLIHLGMSGSVRIHPAGMKPGNEKHDHLIMTMADNQRVVLNDPRRFGGVALMTPREEPGHKLLSAMGIEPLGNSLSGAFLKDAMQSKKTSIKASLLDQRIISGIGNIYASEALFMAGINPRRQAGRISTSRLDLLAGSICKVLEEAIMAGGTSLRDHVQPGGEIGYFAQQLAVYGREGEGCPQCSAPIRMIRQTGRASFYCPQCQR